MGDRDDFNTDDVGPNGPRAWFAPKRIGYGSGLPIAWQGWLVLALYFAVVLASVALPPIMAVVLVIVSTAALVVVCYRRTAGGWRWRGG